MKRSFIVGARLFATGAMMLSPMVGACAIVPKDSVYIHCRNQAGDFMISDLNHSVARYSERYREYRPLCAACNVTQWGNVISMDDGGHVSVWIDRLKGYISVRARGDDGDDDSTGESHSFRGACVRGQMVADLPPPAARRLF